MSQLTGETAGLISSAIVQPFRCLMLQNEEFPNGKVMLFTQYRHCMK